MNTSEELHRALAELATRADDDSRPDRLDRVHRRARRAARNRAVGASLAAVVVIGGAAAVISRAGDTAAPIAPGTQTSVATHPAVSTSPAPTHSSSTSPAPSRPAASTTTSPRSLVAADSKMPAAGACSGQTGSVVTIDANPDVPMPRCVVVRPDQWVRVVNTSDLQGTVGKTLTVTWANFAPRVLRVGQATTFERPAGDYLAVGVHRMLMSPLYGGSAAEVWLQ